MKFMTTIITVLLTTSLILIGTGCGSSSDLTLRSDEITRKHKRPAFADPTVEYAVPESQGPTEPPHSNGPSGPPEV